MHVLVTGASGGLGGAVCQAFLDAGAQVTGAARSWPEAAPFQTLSADLGTAAGCDAMVAEALKHGPIDALMHLVGGFGGGAPLAETGDQTWDGMMNLNVRVAFCVMRAAIIGLSAARITQNATRTLRFIIPSQV